MEEKIMEKILWTMSKIKHTFMKICDGQNIYREGKKRIKQKGEIEDIPAWMYSSMREYTYGKEALKAKASKTLT